VPTQRALGIVATNTLIQRNGQLDPAAIVCRFSKSFVRFGNFELFYHRGEKKNLKKLADYCIDSYYPHVEYDPTRDDDIPVLEVDIYPQVDESSPKKDKADTMSNSKDSVKLNKYARMFQQIIIRTAKLIGT
jgi:uncharacterized protein YdiU (UPF0061 family)